MTQPVPITVAYGDGIGPEIMEAALTVLKHAGAALDIETIEIGERLYRRGVKPGIDPASWESLRRTKVFFKAPITTPQGGGYKSLNVTARTALGLYANVRPCVSYAPFIDTKHPKMDVVIIRENEEDVYAGIEHRQTEQVTQCLKLISRPGCEKIIRYAFDYARAHGRKKVTCFTKDNIMKLTDGLFHRVFKDTALDYPDIASDHMIIDIGTAKLAHTPERFDVLVMPNLYGDILSDVAAQLTGSVGLGGSANIGDQCAMFEAIHGSAPDIAGRGVANPSGLIQASAMMLVHIGQPQVASAIVNAWLRTIEEGIHTPDIYTEGRSKQMVSTTEFARAVVTRLGQTPELLQPVRFGADAPIAHHFAPPSQVPVEARKELVGCDVFVDWRGGDAVALASRVQDFGGADLELTVMTNRGVKVWPGGFPETFCTDHWRCRFLAAGGKTATHAQILALLARFEQDGLDFIQTENLYNFDGLPGFSAAQGE